MKLLWVVLSAGDRGLEIVFELREEYLENIFVAWIIRGGTASCVVRAGEIDQTCGQFEKYEEDISNEENTALQLDWWPRGSGCLSRAYYWKWLGDHECTSDLIRNIRQENRKGSGWGFEPGFNANPSAEHQWTRVSRFDWKQTQSIGNDIAESRLRSLA